MGLRINDIVPNFTAETDHGTISFHDWIGDSWAILFSHPKDFTPVCTTEFGAVAQLADEWAKRNTKVIGVSVDGVEEHKGWKGDIESYAGAEAGFPIIADEVAWTCPRCSTCCPQMPICPTAGPRQTAPP